MAWEECKKACKGKTTFEEVIEAFAPAFMQKLQDSLEVVRKLMPKLFVELTSGKQEISGVIFFGRQGDSLFLAKANFKCNPDTTIPVIITGTGGRYENKPVIIAMGKTDEIKDTIFAKGTWGKGVVPTINNLIKIEIKAHPTKVSEPIDILKVTIKGKTWIQRKNICTN